MKSIDIIENYVSEILRHIPKNEREDIGFELRGIFVEKLDILNIDKNSDNDDKKIIAMLKEFGEPKEIAAQYSPYSELIIPANQTKSFAKMAIGGVLVQWALTLPMVFEGQSIAKWWLSWGLGSFWWPGFMVSMSIFALWFKNFPKIDFKLKSTNNFNAEIDKKVWAFGLFWFVVGVLGMVSFAFLGKLFTVSGISIFEFDQDFLKYRAILAVFLWALVFALRLSVYKHGKWTKTTQSLDYFLNLAFAALLIWWAFADNIFVVEATDSGAKSCLLFTAFLLLIDTVFKFYKRQLKITSPNIIN